MPSLLTTSATPWILLLTGALLRWWMIHLHPQIQGDALLYGDIAANWLQHGIYGHTVGHPSGPPTVEPTLVLGHFVKKINGLSSVDSASLFNLLQAHVTRPENTVR